jgi:hypothetical protein
MNNDSDHVDAAVRIIMAVHNRSGADAAVRVAKQIITTAAKSIAQISGPDAKQIFLYNAASQFNKKKRVRRGTPLKRK